MSDEPGQVPPDVPAPPYPKAEPPAVLYHAVMPDDVAVALRDGLLPTGRPHVHLARRADHARNAIRDTDNASVVLAVDAAAMSRDGVAFYCSPKATWLVDAVPPRYLSEGEGPAAAPAQ